MDKLYKDIALCLRENKEIDNFVLLEILNLIKNHYGLVDLDEAFQKLIELANTKNKPLLSFLLLPVFRYLASVGYQVMEDLDKLVEREVEEENFQ
jgi:hypothetical protein